MRWRCYLYSLEAAAESERVRCARRRAVRQVFEREGCASCHTPPLYTNNKLTPVDGFTVARGPRRQVRHPADARSAPTRTLARDSARHRLLQGAVAQGRLVSRAVRAQRIGRDARRLVRSAPAARRLRADRFQGYGVKTRAVKGHPFGLALSAADKAALIAFLKTL